MDDTSGVGVIDKSVAILDAASRSPASLADLVDATGISRPTAHRLAVALERHGLLTRDDEGRFTIGSRLLEWGGQADPLSALAAPIVVELRDRTGVSAQVYRRQGDRRQCLAAAEPASGLRDGVPVGAMLTMLAGSAAQVLIAWLPDNERSAALRGASFTEADLAECRQRGWSHSLGQREPGVGSMSAPVTDSAGDVIAAVSVSGPIDRLRQPTRAQTRALLDAARALSTVAG